MSRQNFDSYIAPQPGIPSTIHLAHATGAERFLYLVWPEFCARGDPHGWLGLYPSRREVDSAKQIRPKRFLRVPVHLS